MSGEGLPFAWGFLLGIGSDIPPAVIADLIANPWPITSPSVDQSPPTDPTEVTAAAVIENACPDNSRGLFICSRPRLVVDNT